MDLIVRILGIITILIAVCKKITCTENLVSWFVSSTVLPEETHGVFVSQNENSQFADCIFILGGEGNPNSSLCYNISSNEIYSWDNLSHHGYNPTYSNSIMFNNDIIYYLTYDGYIRKYNIENQDVLTLTHYNDLSSSCMVGYYLIPNYLFIIDEDFYIFDINSTTFIRGPSLHYERTDPSCIVHDYSADNDQIPYLYVISGDSTAIERINLYDITNSIDNNNLHSQDWELLNTTLYNITDASNDYENIENSGIASFENFIYLIGGASGRQSYYSDIISIDIESTEVKFVNDFIKDIAAIATISVNNRIYTIGGKYYDSGSYSSKHIDDIFWSQLVSNYNINIIPLSNNDQVTDDIIINGDSINFRISSVAVVTMISLCIIVCIICLSIIDKFYIYQQIKKRLNALETNQKAKANPDINGEPNGKNIMNIIVPPNEPSLPESDNDNEDMYDNNNIQNTNNATINENTKDKLNSIGTSITSFRKKSKKAEVDMSEILSAGSEISARTTNNADILRENDNEITSEGQSDMEIQTVAKSIHESIQ